MRGHVEFKALHSSEDLHSDGDYPPQLENLFILLYKLLYRKDYFQNDI